GSGQVITVRMEMNTITPNFKTKACAEDDPICKDESVYPIPDVVIGENGDLIDQGSKYGEAKSFWDLSFPHSEHN
ncbi:unnamed protein product, partial [Sphenostylis stenocarpa]